MDELIRQIQAFLTTHKKSEDSGWPEVTPTEVNTLQDIFIELLTGNKEYEIDGNVRGYAISFDGAKRIVETILRETDINI